MNKYVLQHNIFAKAAVNTILYVQQDALDYIDLARSLKRPAHDDSRIRYILSSTPQLNDELRAALSHE